MEHPKWNSQELIDRYQREYAIDVRRFVPDDQVTMCRDEASGIWMFRGAMPGDGYFYEQLQARDEYYLKDKWEFGEALSAISDLPKDARILEIGCGTGAFLDLCREAGWKHIRGLELNWSAVRVCRDKGHDVSGHRIDELDPDVEPYDCICAFQVLEHVPNPVEFLHAAAKHLRSGGRFIASTPNAASFLARYKWCLLDLPPHHMSRWDETSYRKSADLIGLSVVDIRREPLAKYHYKFFANSLVEQIRSVRLRRAIKPLARLGFAVYPWKASIAGHSMLAVLSKPAEKHSAAWEQDAA